MMINCRIIYNNSCLKCDQIELEMIRIGAFVMCRKCFEDEFNTEEFDPKSAHGKTYYMWLKLYKKRYDY